MSFAREVKEELVKRTGNARHCRIAELCALAELLGRIEQEPEGAVFEVRTENLLAAEQIAALTEKLLREPLDRRIVTVGRQKTAVLRTKHKEATETLLQTLKLEALADGSLSKPKELVLQRSCCKRAYIRGAFLASGSVSNPEKAYHFEIVLVDTEKAQFMQNIINSFDIDAKIVLRKKANVVYVKEGSQISDLLSIMEAHIALMKLENVRILKDMRNMINRQVNCEAANITKTVTAATRQIDDIIYIRDTVGFEDLSDDLRNIAELRLKYPEATLKELGGMLPVPIGKSGVNHRLAKLCSVAQEIRER